MGGIALAFLMEYLDQTIRTEDDVQKYYDLPVLTVVPIADQAGRGFEYGCRSGKEKRSDEAVLRAEGKEAEVVFSFELKEQAKE
jgi:sulfate adenylyltransferase subunit 1 (EFTu-like GTPase family)